MKMQMPPFPPLSWQYECVIVVNVVVVLVTIFSLCVCYTKRKILPQSQSVDSTHGNYNNGVMLEEGNKSEVLQQTPEEGKQVQIMMPTSLDGVQDELSVSWSSRSSVLGKFRRSPFQTSEVEIQPTTNTGGDLSAFNICSLPLPEVIPEAPTRKGKEDLGSLHFNVSYDVFESTLTILIRNAVNLSAEDILSGSSDPFVKLFLRPGKNEPFKTKVKKKNLNPVWNEEFSFVGLPHEDLQQTTLCLEVFDHDIFTRNDSLGETHLTLGSVSIREEPVEFEKRLYPSKNSRGSLGDLLISMSYNPTSGRITIVVMKANQLRTMDITGKSDPYVKVHLLYSGTRLDKQKTQVKKRSLNPIWNAMMEFDAPPDQIRRMTLVFTVMDYDVILPDKNIGKVTIGYSTTGTSLKHWTDVLTNSNKPIAKWHMINK